MYYNDAYFGLNQAPAGAATSMRARRDNRAGYRYSERHGANSRPSRNVYRPGGQGGPSMSQTPAYDVYRGGHYGG